MHSMWHLSGEQACDQPSSTQEALGREALGRGQSLGQSATGTNSNAPRASSGPPGLETSCLLLSAQPSKGLLVAQEKVPDLPASWDSLITTRALRGCHSPLTTSLQQKNCETSSGSPLGGPREEEPGWKEAGEGLPGARTCWTQGSPHLLEGGLLHVSFIWAPGPAGWPHSPHFSCFPRLFSVSMHYVHFCKWPQNIWGGTGREYKRRGIKEHRRPAGPQPAAWGSGVLNTGCVASVTTAANSCGWEAQNSNPADFPLTGSFKTPV